MEYRTQHKRNKGNWDWGYLILIILVMVTFVAIKRYNNVPNGVVLFPTGYAEPKDLFYTFLKADKTYITQSQEQHFNNNGYLATDIGTNKRKLSMYAPSFLELDEEGNLIDKALEYEVKITSNFGTTGKTLELHWDNKYWEIDRTTENKYFMGRNQETNKGIGDKWGWNVNIVCYAHQTKRSTVKLEEVRSGISSQNKSTTKKDKFY